MIRRALRITILIFLWVVALGCAVWAFGALHYDFAIGKRVIPWVFAAAIILAVIFLRRPLRKLAALSLAFALVLAWWLTLKPSNDRKWQSDVTHLAWADINGDEITAYHVPPAHTDGDSFVRFRNANVVHTGDVFASGRYPFIDSTNGGSVKGIVAAIDKLLPELDDFTKVIPGHGPVSTKREVIAYRNMISTVASRVEEMVKQGKTLEQVIAAKPLKEFDAEWGKFRKTDDFIPFVYYGFAPYKPK